MEVSCPSECDQFSLAVSELDSERGVLRHAGSWKCGVLESDCAANIRSEAKKTL